MTSDADQSDYKNGHYIVFYDDLDLTSEMKHMIEAGSLDMFTENPMTLATSACDWTLTAEKKKKPDGSRYILVRRATKDEEDKLFGIGKYADEAVDEDEGDT